MSSFREYTLLPSLQSTLQTLDFTTPNVRDSVTLSGSTSGTLEDTGVSEDAAFYRVESK